MTQLLEIAPAEIEKRSFAIIQEEFFSQTSIDPDTIDNDLFMIIQRVIHATGDFSFARSLVFHENAISSGLRAIRNGKNVYFDVTMGATGVSAHLLRKYGGEVICKIKQKNISALAEKKGKTRTETALAAAVGDNIGIVAIGNAPTALLQTLNMIEEKQFLPDLVIGVPVGFVNASESKELLQKSEIPFISNIGRKGGSSVAVAIINALLRMV